MTYKDVVHELKENSDAKYKDFIAKLVPTIEKDTIIGVRMGDLRRLAREIKKEVSLDIFNEAKFYYREEKLLYALCIFKMSESFDKAMNALDEFLSYIDNWEVTDLIAGEIIIDEAHIDKAFQKALSYVHSSDEYTIRLGLVIMNKKFNDKAHIDKIIDAIKNITLNTYYVNMAAAWLLCELYFTDKAKVDEFLSSEAINMDIKKMTRQKIRESLKK
ncbi:MAG: DNA alkylation repair protein [Eubacteriales bacterium]|uniref:DNA alkylation repair protein n=1 Tax=Fenollaria sp. TaxID=1965292 RepID=UPI002A75DF5A|nr:DNA alkylation repair protein [Fenollaria sp.]MDD7339846.1 DNA alkylation repair protein [Eubacteriales bacterium]MDY3106074.1 DNA alkylation repair protein [Fenollaria sp.]